MKFRALKSLALVAALAAACLPSGTPARAQAPTPAAVAVAKELVVMRGGMAMFDPLIPGVIESAKNSFLPTHPQLAQQLDQVAVALRKEYEPKRNEILDELSKIYAQHFTEQELKEIVTFYKSPLGKKLITQEPVVIDDSLKATQAWAAQFSDQVLERFRVEMKKKGYSL